MSEETTDNPASATEFTHLPPAPAEPDFLRHLEYEANRRGVSVQEVYDEEMAARAELARITSSYGELASLARRSPPPQEWYDE
jgi:hypothetical protein